MAEGRRRPRSIKWLILLAAVAVAYDLMLHFMHTVTGMHLRDGIIGVVLGLYICSRPAANMLDMVLFDRIIYRHEALGRQVAWVLVNVLVFVAGYTVIANGATQFALASATALLRGLGAGG